MLTSAEIAAKRNRCSIMSKNANFESRYADKSVESAGKTYHLIEIVIGQSLYGRKWGEYAGVDFVVIKLKKRRGASHAYAFYTHKKTPKKKPAKKKK